jgi:hypothetical protein
MARDILSEYGPERKGGGGLKGHGQVSQRDTQNYSPPKGPTNINDPKGPGLHGHNCGNAGTQGYHGSGDKEGGSPGIGGTVHPKGSQR